jgi:small subunit ribosomal protein S17
MTTKKTKEVKCDDIKCPVHGNLKLRGREFEGILTNITVSRSATLEFNRTIFNHKYERSEQKRTILHVHNPACINAQKGDKVIVSECRRLSKTKKFVIIKNLGKAQGFSVRQELLAEGKFKRKKKEEGAEATEATPETVTEA